MQLTKPKRPIFYVGVMDYNTPFPEWMTNEEIKEVREIISFSDKYVSALVIVMGDKIEVYSDDGEIEDKLFCRDLNWIAPAVQKAFEFGKEVLKNERSRQ